MIFKSKVQSSKYTKMKWILMSLSTFLLFGFRTTLYDFCGNLPNDDVLKGKLKKYNVIVSADIFKEKNELLLEKMYKVLADSNQIQIFAIGVKSPNINSTNLRRTTFIDSNAIYCNFNALRQSIILFDSKYYILGKIRYSEPENIIKIIKFNDK